MSNPEIEAMGFSLAHRYETMSDYAYRDIAVSYTHLDVYKRQQVAYADACKIEHDLSEESFARLRAHFSAHQKAEPSHPETT